MTVITTETSIPKRRRRPRPAVRKPIGERHVARLHLQCTSCARNGYRSRRHGGYLVPLCAKATWRDHRIPDKWWEKVNHRIHLHAKPVNLIARLIGAVTKPGDLAVDPVAGGRRASGVHGAGVLRGPSDLAGQILRDEKRGVGTGRNGSRPSAIDLLRSRR
jgi:hypothetical protein